MQTDARYSRRVDRISFRKTDLPERPTARSDGHDEPDYINPCCVGGDLVLERLLSALRERCTRVEQGQEDWGWYAWGYAGSRRLAVHTQCDDVEHGDMTALLWVYERGPWWQLWREREVVGPELDALRDLVLAALDGWTDGPVAVDREPRERSR